MPKIIFSNKNVTVEVNRGLSVLEAALENDINLYHTCGGNASCSTCRVRILKGGENLSPIESAEAQVLDAFDLKTPYRLGCQALMIKGEVTLEIPDRDKNPRENKTPPISKGRLGKY